MRITTRILIKHPSEHIVETLQDRDKLGKLEQMDFCLPFWKFWWKGSRLSPLPWRWKEINRCWDSRLGPLPWRSEIGYVCTATWISFHWPVPSKRLWPPAWLWENDGDEFKPIEGKSADILHLFRCFTHTYTLLTSVLPSRNTTTAATTQTLAPSKAGMVVLYVPD